MGSMTGGEGTRRRKTEDRERERGDWLQAAVLRTVSLLRFLYSRLQASALVASLVVYRTH